MSNVALLMDCLDLRNSASSQKILIVGMHRSGTSALAQVLSALGVDFGPNLLGASHANPFGHFEDNFVLSYNEDLLRRAGGCWDAPPSKEKIRQCWLKKKDELKPYLLKISSKDTPFALKEPRTALMLDLYLALDFFTHVIFITRNPEHVAKSLKSRNGFSIKYANRLIDYYIDELNESYEKCSLPKIKLSYEDMISKKSAFISDVSFFLELPKKDGKIMPAEEAIVSGSSLKQSISNFKRKNIFLAAIQRPAYAVAVALTRMRRFIKRIYW